MRPTEFHIAKDITYKLPEGHFKAVITRVDKRSAKNTDDESENIIIHFDVSIKGMENFECCARAIFPDDHSRNSELRYFLEKILGKQFFMDRADQKIDLNAELRNKPCEIDLVHGKHDKKYLKVRRK